MKKTYYRPLVKGENIVEGDGWFHSDGGFVRNIGDAGRPWEKAYGETKVSAIFRPVTIEEADPTPVCPHLTHRVEDETWEIRQVCTKLGWGEGIGVKDKKYVVCSSADFSEALPGAKERSAKRLKRICAGQEALKYLERHAAYGTNYAEVTRILAMLKD